MYDFADDAADNPTFYADLTNPQSLNKYQYVLHNPLRYTDDDGHCGVLCLAARGAAVAARTPVGQRVITAAGGAATTVIVAASGVIKEIPGALKYALDHGGNSAARQDMDDLRISRQGNKSAPTEVTIDGTKHPEAARHAADAQNAGQPDTLTVDRAGAEGRRKEAMGGSKPVSGSDRDEYPPAVTKEGGRGASVRPISPHDNRGAGSSVGRQIRNVPDGGKIKIKVIKIELF